MTNSYTRVAESYSLFLLKEACFFYIEFSDIKMKWQLFSPLLSAHSIVSITSLYFVLYEFVCVCVLHIIVLRNAEKIAVP